MPEPTVKQMFHEVWHEAIRWVVTQPTNDGIELHHCSLRAGTSGIIGFKANLQARGLATVTLIWDGDEVRLYGTPVVEVLTFTLANYSTAVTELHLFLNRLVSSSRRI